MAWVGSSAGMIPSVRQSSLKPSSASIIGRAVISHAADFLQPAMLRPDAGIIEASRDAVRLIDLAVFILKQIGLVAVQDTGATAREADAACCLSRPWPAASMPSISTVVSSRKGWNSPIAFDPPPIAATSRSGKLPVALQQSVRALPCRSRSENRGRVQGRGAALPPCR